MLGENRFLQLAFLFVLLASTCMAGEVRNESEYSQSVVVLQQGTTIAKVAPGSGLNVYSITVDGFEYLHQPDSPERVPGVSCGVPILYPTPNRVKGGTFTFQDSKVQFEPLNGRGNHIHGLVNRQSWKVTKTEATPESASVTCQIDFAEGSELAQLFPFSHQLRVQVLVKDGSVRWNYVVDNKNGQSDVPFGFALHPYFVYQGDRARTFLTIPASHWMESIQQLPTGKLVEARDLEYSLGEPMSLENTKFDDVFWGMTPASPTLIDFRDRGRQIRIQASQEFTHLVVWTPPRPFFGIESQTCSTDAHNLHSQGKVKEAHLQIAEAGKAKTGWVEYQFFSR